jgi:hypothetical protein
MLRQQSAIVATATLCARGEKQEYAPLRTMLNNTVIGVASAEHTSQCTWWNWSGSSYLSLLRMWLTSILTQMLLARTLIPVTEGFGGFLYLGSLRIRLFAQKVFLRHQGQVTYPKRTYRR